MRRGHRERTAASPGKADLHIHSAAGDGISSISEILDHVEHYTDLDVIAITDHDEVSGALEARELAAQRGYRFEVITGSEVTTRDGHLLALFVEKRLPMLRSLEATVERVQSQGGVCVVPHPLSWLTLSVGRSRLLRLHNSASGLRLDGIELLNPTIAGRVTVREAKLLNHQVLGLAETGGSDAHNAALIGTGCTLFPGHTAADLRRALLERTTRSHGVPWTAGDHLQGAVGQQFRSLVVHPYRKVARAMGRGETR